VVVRSYISNSNERLPAFNFQKVYAVAAILLVALLAAWNAIWISVGFPLQPKDNAELWSYYRRRATLAREDAIVFIGSSRMQAGIDLNEVSLQTGKIPFQLSIAGKSPVRILENLSEDDSFNGTVVVEITEYALYNQFEDNKEDWVTEYQENRYGNGNLSLVKGFVQSLVVFPNFGNNASEVLTNVFTGKVFYKGYLNQLIITRNPTTALNRSSQGFADRYPPEIIEQWRQFLPRLLKSSVAEGKLDKTRFIKLGRQIEDYTKRIQARGGKVILVRFPFNGETNDLHEMYFPKKDFWDELAAQSSAQTIYYSDYPALAEIEAIDGMHFSGQNATIFTRELFNIINHKDR
jgi:hypothetical protein